MNTPTRDHLAQQRPESNASGILPSQAIRSLVDAKRITAQIPIDNDQIQPASIDLRLGREAYQVRASFLPGKTPIAQKIRDLLIQRINLTGSAVLAPGSVFIVPLIESLALPSDVYGKANPKSTTGRLDIFTRLITEPGHEFELVPRGYSGPLYLEVVSRTFPVVIRTGMKLNQLRFVRGKSDVSDNRLIKLAETERLVYEDDENHLEAQIERGLRVSVDLQGSGSRSNVVAYKAKNHTPPIDMENVNHYDIDDFWDVIRGPLPKGLTLNPRDFYILASWERISVPPSYAAEMVPFDPSIGEFRIHYAGFFDPGFGHGMSGIKGTKAVLEVRAHEVPILLEDRQLVGKLLYHKMAKEPDKIYGPSIGSSYQQQGLQLSKQFKKENSDQTPSTLGPTLAPQQLVTG
jgi:dCTP deaminase